MAEGLLAKKVVVVTGAGRSLGAVIARACADDAATVVATDMTGGEGSVVRHDVTSADDWARILGEVADAHGRVDGLVNNAAIIMPSGPFLDESPADFARVLDVNVMGV